MGCTLGVAKHARSQMLERSQLEHKPFEKPFAESYSIPLLSVHRVTGQKTFRNDQVTRDTDACRGY